MTPIICPHCLRPLLRGDFRTSKKYLRGYILPCRDCLTKRSTEHKRKAREKEKKEKEEKKTRMSQAEWLALVDQQLETLQQWRPYD